MATITTRSGKGSPLTNTEVDNNFTNLNTAKYESGDNVSLGTASFTDTSNTTATVVIGGHQDGNLIEFKSGGTTRFYLYGGGTGDDQLTFNEANGDAMISMYDAAGVVINEDSVDQDFRVESNGSTHMLFVDAGSNEVGINISGPTSTLDVNGIITGAEENVTHGARILRGRYGTGSITTFGSEASSGGPMLGYGVWPKDSTAQAYVSSSNLSNLQRSAITLSGNEVEFWFGSPQTVTEDDDVTIAKKINLSMSLFEFNKDGENTDFRVQSDSNSNGLFFDASASALGINKLPDSNGYYALDIDGVIRQNGATVSGIVYPYRGTVTRALNAPTEWFKIYTVNSASSRIVRMRLQHGGDNTNFMGEFVFNMAGYSFSHSITLENYTYYNGPQLLEVFTRTVSNTTLEIWAKVEALTSYAGSFNIYSNDGNVIASPTAVSTEPTGINARLRSTHWPGSTSRSSAAWSDAIHLTNASPVRFYRSDDTRHSSMYHDNAGLKIETNYSGDNIYLRNASGTTGNVFIDNGDDGYSVVVNDISADTDFRVESNDQSHMFFVDGGNSYIGIKQSTPGAPLDVNGPVHFSAWRTNLIEGGGANDYWYKVYEVDFQSSSFNTNTHHIRLIGAGGTSGSAGFAEFYVTYKQQTGNKYFNIFPIEKSGLYLGYTWDATGGDHSAGRLTIYARSRSGNYMYIQNYATARDSNTPGTHNRGVPQVTSTGTDTTPTGYVEIAAPLYTQGNRYTTSGHVSNELIINQEQLDLDTRIASDDQTHMLFVDGGANRVTVGGSTQAAVMTVQGGSTTEESLWIYGEATGKGGRIVTIRDSRATAGTDGSAGLRFTSSPGTDYVIGKYYDGSISNFMLTDQAGGEYYTIEAAATSVFNQGGVSARDFRVESSTNSHMLFVDSSANTVSVGTSGTYNNSAFNAYRHATGESSAAFGGMFYGNVGAWYSNLYLGSSSTSQSTYIIVAPYDNGNNGQYAQGVEGYLHISRGTNGAWNEASRTYVHIKTAWDNTQIKGMAGDYNLYTLYYDDGNGSKRYWAVGPISATSNRVVHFQGNVYQQNNWRPFIVYANQVTTVAFQRDGNQFLIDGFGVATDSSPVVFNEGGANSYDFRVESDSNTHALFVDATYSSTVCFGTDNINLHNQQIEGCNIGGNGNVGQIIASTENNRPLILHRWGSNTPTGQIIELGCAGSTVGSVNVDSSGTTYNTTSDLRLKENIEAITDGTAKVMAMNPVTHTWKNVPEAPAVHGFIAQEMIGIVPEAVSGDPTGEEMMSMDYGRITPVLVAALQDAHKKIAELETRLNEMEGK